MAENRMILIIVVLAEFLCGSLMFSYWLGLAVKKDLNTIGDGNPGAFNLWHAAGAKLGITGIILDFMKGYLPLVFIYEAELVKGNYLIPVALAPVFGHVFPIFNKFKGGKAIAVTFGVWSAITRFQVSFIFAVILAVIQLAARIIKKGKAVSTEADGVMVIVGMMILGIYLKVLEFSGYYIIIWLVNFIIFLYANRVKLYKYFKEKVDKQATC